MKSTLNIGGIPAFELAQQFGTPLYVYDQALIAQAQEEWKNALSMHPNHRLCYAVKANGSLKLLHYLAQAGLHFDIVSGGELARLVKVGVGGERVVFSGVGKSIAEIEMALSIGVSCFNIESVAEMDRLSDIGKAHGCKVPVAVRVNPEIDAKTHPYISTGLTENKFGLTINHLREQAARLADDPWLNWLGLDCHIGSNMHDPAPYGLAAKTLFDLLDEFTAKGIALHHLDFGGGIGVRYRPEDSRPLLKPFLQPILERAKNYPHLTIMFEPGRRLVAEAGFLLTQVEMIKTTPSHRFVVVDASMTELLRPALYQAFHEIVPAWQADESLPSEPCEVVGPVCESADFLGKQRTLAVQAGDGVAIKTAGAYGMVMASNYNARPRPAEVWIENGKPRLIRERENYDQLFRDEHF